MTRSRLFNIGALILGATAMTGSTAYSLAFHGQQPFKQEFHQTYPLSAGGHIRLENINGNVHIQAWDSDLAQVDAVKYSNSQQDLDAAEIVVDARPDTIAISTKYNKKYHPLDRAHDSRATIEYTLMVPRNAHLDSVQLVNGDLSIKGVSGIVEAASVNGHVYAAGLRGASHLSAPNGKVEVDFDRQDTENLELDSVNGSVAITVPPDANARLAANTLRGKMSNDFGLPVQEDDVTGRDLKAQWGDGHARIKLQNVNGNVAINRATDGRTNQ
jgi:hypothetical protein